MHSLLQRQIKRAFGKDFDASMQDASLVKLLDAISGSYDELYKEKRFLEHTLEMNSEELTRANIKIQEQNAELQKNLEKTSDANEEMIHMLKQYKRAIDTSLIVSVTSPDGVIKYVNDNFIKISGYSRYELLGKKHNIIRHPQNPQELFTEIWKTILAKEVWQGIIPNLAKDGSTYYVNAAIVPLLNREGEIVEFMALRKDITSTIEYQKKVEIQKQRVSDILDNQESIIVVLDPKEGIKEVNKKFFELFGFETLEKFLQKHRYVCELFETKEGFLRESSSDVLWLESILKEPHKVHLASIDGRIYSVKIATIDKEEELRYLATFTDITPIEEARIKSLEAEREKANFLANMSHEIRTPMNAILGFSELLAKTELDARQSKFIELIKNSSATLIQIINDILDFSKLESGHNPIELTKINPFMEFESTLMLLAGKAREKEISYMIEIDPALGECVAVDSFHIKQILTNLIGNAIKFTPSGGTVHVKIQKQGQKIRFCVEDSGIGIPKERQQKIFEPFSQADSSTTRKFGGTGLGLSISNTLVTLMQSKLELESKEGVGSKFYFDVAYSVCDSKSTLKEHLRDFSLYLFGMDAKNHENLASQLNAYGIAWSTLEAYSKEADKSNAIIIAKNEEMTDAFCEAKILFLGTEGKTKEDVRHHHIEVFEEFPSILYNELMRLELIKTEIKEIKKSLQMRVLAAEDYEINRLLLSELLMSFGVTYDFALNGQEAVEKAKANHYDLILMDVNMPVMNGIEATRILIQELHIKTPIVALTANALEGDREKFLSLGMADYLTKPIDTKALEAVLSRYAVAQLQSQKMTMDIKASLEKSREKMRFSEAIMQKVFISFVSSLETLEQNMRDGWEQREFSKIHMSAHNLKSGAASLCFDTLSKISTEIEAAAKREDENFDFLGKFQEILPYLDAIKEFKATLG